jgi:hypothetical protein
MPFDARFIAIERLFGRYSVHSQFNAYVDQTKFRRSSRVSNVSTNPGYRDFAGIFTRAEVFGFDPSEHTSNWLTSLPANIEFILVVLEEWESGLC